RAVLEAFQVNDWQGPIDDPLGDGEGSEAAERLRETVKSLNEGLPAGTIRFHTDGRGGSVRWSAGGGSLLQPGENASRATRAANAKRQATGIRTGMGPEQRADPRLVRMRVACLFALTVRGVRSSARDCATTPPGPVAYSACGGAGQVLPHLPFRRPA